MEKEAREVANRKQKGICRETRIPFAGEKIVLFVCFEFGFRSVVFYF